MSFCLSYFFEYCLFAMFSSVAQHYIHCEEFLALYIFPSAICQLYSYRFANVKVFCLLQDRICLRLLLFACVYATREL